MKKFYFLPLLILGSLATTAAAMPADDNIQHDNTLRDKVAQRESSEDARTFWSHDLQYRVISEDDKTAEIIGHKDLMFEPDYNFNTIAEQHNYFIGESPLVENGYMPGMSGSDGMTDGSGDGTGDGTGDGMGMTDNMGILDSGNYTYDGYVNADGYVTDVYGAIIGAMDTYLMYDNYRYDYTMGYFDIFDTVYDDETNQYYTVVAVGDYAFAAMNDSVYIEHLTFGDGITRIGKYAFNDLIGLKQLRLPIYLREIDDYAFSGCTTTELIYLDELTMDPMLPETLQRIGAGAFMMCCISYSPTYTLEIPNSVTEIGEHAFDSSSVYSIKLPESLTEISDYAFANMFLLESINIPSTVTRIGVGAFKNTPTLVNVDFNNTENLTEICESAFESALSYLPTRDYDLVVPNSVTRIGKYAFADCSGLSSVTLPDQITTIEEGTFKYAGLTEIKYPAHLQAIEDYAFSYSYINEINIPEGVTKIGKEAFSCCRSATSLVIPSTVTEIGEKAFSDSEWLESITCNWTEDEYLECEKDIFYLDTYSRATLYVKEIPTVDPWDYFIRIEKVESVETGVDDAIIGDAALAEYFDLQGRKVAHPANGIFIKKESSKVTKVIL
jgi:hypothetical protein